MRKTDNIKQNQRKIYWCVNDIDQSQNLQLNAVTKFMSFPPS